jgi:hypothetical protein
MDTQIILVSGETMNDEQKVTAQLIDTWQPVAAIAYRANLTLRRTLEILLTMHDAGLVKMNRVRLDGHNRVHIFKKIKYAQVFCQRIPIDNSHDEYELTT